MTSATVLTNVLTIGTFFLVIALVAYRLLWASSSFAGYFAGARWLPEKLQRVQQWLHGERR